MKKLSLVVCIMLFAVALFAADYSGTWVLNEDKSELGEGRWGRMAPNPMIVEQTDKEITIKFTRTGRDGEERQIENTVKLNGKETKQDSQWGKTTMKAKPADDALTIDTVREFDRNGEKFEMFQTQKWTLSDDGKMLTVVSTSESPRGERTTKMVYDKE